MHSFIDTKGQQHPERRQNLRLRSIYDEARGRIDHFFHSNNNWAGSSIDYLALRIVHEAYPDLNPEEVRTLVAAIERAATKSPPKPQ